MLGVLIKRGNLDRDIGSISCKDEDKDVDNVSISQGTPHIARKPPEARMLLLNLTRI